MDIKKIILKELKRKDSIRTSDLVSLTGFTRAYINRFLKELVLEKLIVQIGKSVLSKYILPEKMALLRPIEKLQFHRIAMNKNLSEDFILKDIYRETLIFSDLRENVKTVLEYAFSEMMNNAIEHSCSESVDFNMRLKGNIIDFSIKDKGIGIFNNIREKKNLPGIYEAIQDLIKGKQTTVPEFHSGEGIYFTSRIADYFLIKSSLKKIVFDNENHDVYIKDCRFSRGTEVYFRLKSNSEKELTHFSRF